MSQDAQVAQCGDDEEDEAGGMGEGVTWRHVTSRHSSTNGLLRSKRHNSVLTEARCALELSMFNTCWRWQAGQLVRRKARARGQLFSSGRTTRYFPWFSTRCFHQTWAVYSPRKCGSVWPMKGLNVRRMSAFLTLPALPPAAHTNWSSRQDSLTSLIFFFSHTLFQNVLLWANY